jgi:hypothetical protein
MYTLRILYEAHTTPVSFCRFKVEEMTVEIGRSESLYWMLRILCTRRILLGISEDVVECRRTSAVGRMAAHSEA